MDPSCSNAGCELKPNDNAKVRGCTCVRCFRWPLVAHHSCRQHWATTCLPPTHTPTLPTLVHVSPPARLWASSWTTL